MSDATPLTGCKAETRCQRQITRSSSTETAKAPKTDSEGPSISGRNREAAYGAQRVSGRIQAAKKGSGQALQQQDNCIGLEVRDTTVHAKIKWL